MSEGKLHKDLNQPFILLSRGSHQAHNHQLKHLKYSNGGEKVGQNQTKNPGNYCKI